MAREIRGKIYSYTYSFHRYAKWLYLNGIEYELRVPSGEIDEWGELEHQYGDALTIIVYKSDDKRKRRLADMFFDQIFPQIRERNAQFGLTQGVPRNYN